MKAPVALLIYNRPAVTRRVFESIAKVRPERLLVIADGPMPNDPVDEQKCASARKLTEDIDWTCDVTRDYSQHNLGLKARVSTGLDLVFDHVEEAIILEDDCLPHPKFFPFSELMLERYREEDRVMMISGTNYLLDRAQIPWSYAFSRYFAIWGWATWRDAWRRYDISMKRWPALKEEGKVDRLFKQPYMQSHLKRLFDDAWSEREQTWDVQWLFAGVASDGLAVVPKVNLVTNIGFEGVHASGFGGNEGLPVFDIDLEELRHPPMIEPTAAYDEPFFREQFRETPLARWSGAVKRKAYSIIHGDR